MASCSLVLKSPRIGDRGLFYVLYRFKTIRKSNQGLETNRRDRLPEHPGHLLLLTQWQKFPVAQRRKKSSLPLSVDSMSSTRRWSEAQGWASGTIATQSVALNSPNLRPFHTTATKREGWVQDHRVEEWDEQARHGPDCWNQAADRDEQVNSNCL